MKESVLNKIIICSTCHTAYIPGNDICACVDPTAAVIDFMYEPKSDEAAKHEEWHDKLVEGDK